MAATRLARPAAAAAPVVLPGDVRLMNVVASSLFVLAALALVAAGVLWLRARRCSRSEASSSKASCCATTSTPCVPTPRRA
jgi:hypothetical protein